MLLHYLKIALRNLAKQKMLAFINVFGLSVGIACFSLFLIYAINEFSYDRFHSKGDRIFRVNQWWTGNKERGPMGNSGSYLPLGPAMKADLPDVENYMRFMGGGERFVKVNNTVSRVPISFADPSMFQMFSFKLITGNADHALKELYSIVLTRDKAIQLFGATEVLGKIVNIKWGDAFEPFVVSGVVENIPSRSSLQFDILGNFNYIYTTQDGKEAANNWHMTIGIETYAELKKSSKIANVSKQLIAFRKKYYADEEAQMIKDKQWDGKSPYPISFVLQHLKDMHTDPTIMGEQITTNPKNIWILISIAAGILLIACINFTTLAIGRSAGRAREVGVRKAIGSGRKQLIGQFLTESVLLSIISGMLGLILVNLLMPYFNQLSGRTLRLSFGQFPQLTWMLGGLILLVGILAGIYPAFILSGFRAIEVLKSKIKLGGSNFFTKSLVTLQFVLSAALIISTIIIVRQLHFLRSKDLGFNKENVIDVSAFGSDAKKIFPLFNQELQSDPQILGISGSQLGLGEGKGEMNDRYIYKDKEFFPIKYPVDASYINVTGMQIIAGRNFSRDFSLDTVESVIVNETLAKTELGLTPENAIGKQLSEGFWGVSKPQVIIGVVRDFNFEPLTRKVRSQLFTMPSDLDPVNFFVRIRAGDPSAAVAALQSAWKKSSNDFPFKYSFLDEDLDRFYKSEEKWSGIIGWAGTISIFLACLGLFGLSALSAVNRTKEIGIRKVLGASIGTIVQLLSKDFLRLVIIALVIASPLAWYFMNKWLQDYAYRINIGWFTFAITGVIALLIAFITIGFQSIKAATANPVKSLRTE